MIHIIKKEDFVWSDSFCTADDALHNDIYELNAWALKCDCVFACSRSTSLEPNWAAWVSEHIARGQWPKTHKIDGSDSNLGQQTVFQVQLPRGY